MIEFQHVSFRYPEGGDGGLHDVSLTIPDGQRVLLCGRSGCGKTTLTRLVNGLIPQFFPGELTGRVLLDGEDLAALPMYRISEKVGSVFQNPRTQFFNVDSDSEIAFGLESQARPAAELRARVDRTAEELGIRGLLGRSLFALSGGEKQRIAFASVYAMEPEVCLLDEPSSNLDAQAIEGLRRHLALLRSQGKTILVAEHRLSYLMDTVDRVLYLEGGRVAGDYSREAFLALSPERRRAMGLRAADLMAERPSAPSSPAAAPRLELRDVSLSYGKRTVLQGLSLQAAPGEIIALAGPNGAGKTTLSRFLCGLHRESGGQLLWEGRVQSPRERRGRAGLVMQDVNYQLFAESVEAECVFSLRRPDTALAEEALRELGLWALRDRHPNTLSGGQKQRLAAAAAMVQGRELLVFDEPTSGLDYDSMTRLAELLRRLSVRGKVIFLVTHDFEFVCRTCGRALWLSGGGLRRDLPVTAETLPALREIFHVR